MITRTWTIFLITSALVLALWLLLRGGAAEGDVGGGAEGEVVVLAAAGALPKAEGHPELRLAARATIRGHVVDPKGRGIAGASVCAGALASGLSQVERQARNCVVSEADGSYRIEGLLPVQHFVHASAPTFIPAPYLRGSGAKAVARVTLRAGGEARDIDITLQPGGVEVKGVVRDISGGELVGAQVSSRYAYTHSQADGSFSLWLGPGVFYLSASADGYADESLFGSAPGHVLEVYLTPESVLVGRVVRAEDGAPLEGAEVWAKSGTGWGQEGPALTDAGGNFRLAGLEPGAYKAEATHEEAYGMAEEQVVLGLGETSAQVEIRAHPAFMVEGRVVIAGGAGCEQGSLTLRKGAEEERRVMVEEDGAVQVRGLLPGSYEVQVDCDHYVPQPRYEALEIVDASLKGLRWEVAPGQAILGMVVRGKGEPASSTGSRPASDLSVSARAIVDKEAPRAQTTNARGLTDAEGRFEILGLLPGRYKLETWSQDQAPADPLEVELRAGQDLAEIRLTVPAGGELQGKVLDSEGRPVKGVDVSLRGEKWGLPQTRTGEDGSFQLKDVPPGEYRVIAGRGNQELRAPGTTDDDAQGKTVNVAVDAVTRVELIVEAQGGKISGRVVDTEGGPLVDAFIEATRESDSAAAAAGSSLRRSRWSSFFGGEPARLTDQEGRFELKGLSAGNYTLIAHRRGGGEGTLEHVAVGSEVEIRMAEAGSLSGSVRVVGGGAPTKFSVSIHARKSGYQARDEFFRTGGSFRFPEVPEGDYEVSVESPEGSNKAKTSVPTGGRGEVQIELTPRVRVRGRLVDIESGAPVVGMKVQFTAGGSITLFNDSGTGKEITDNEGHFTVEQVPVGEVQVSVIPKNFSDSEYGWSWIPTRIPAGSSEVELPAFKLARQRSGENERAGDLGFKLREGDPEVKPEAQQLLVGFVEPGGPAAQAGLQVDDEIVSVDGHEVTGLNSYLYRSLIDVKAGAKLRFGLRRGGSVEITSR